MSEEELLQMGSYSLSSSLVKPDLLSPLFPSACSTPVAEPHAPDWSCINGQEGQAPALEIRGLLGVGSFWEGIPPENYSVNDFNRVQAKGLGKEPLWSSFLFFLMDIIVVHIY